MRCCALLAFASIATCGTSTASVYPVWPPSLFLVTANAYDTRTSGAGCSPDGCRPENTLDNNRASNSRWSCKTDLIENDENCMITYHFSEPQNIVRMRIAFHRGDEITRKLKIKLNGITYNTVESSGYTLGYQTFMLNTDETEKLTLEAVDLEGAEWISITEVEFGIL